MFHFLDKDIGEQKKYEMRQHTSADYTVNDVRYEIKFENCVKNKNNFFVKKHFSFLNKNVFYSWRHIFLRFLRI